MWLAHRLAYEFTYPGGLSGSEVLMHLCDNPPCCNPNHLRPGSVAENNADARAHGLVQPAKGQAHGRTTLSDHQVLEIRERYATGGVRQMDLAKAFGISQPSVSSIIRRETWTHI